MANFKYPQNDFDNADKLLSLLGSYWATSYLGNNLIQDLTGVTGQMAQQTHRQLLELISSVSRYSVPIFHKENWYALTFKESEINVDDGLLAKYVTPPTANYSATTALNYGELRSQSFYSVSKPDTLKDVGLIFDQIASPTVELVQGIDYWLADTTIAFRRNPFENPNIPQRDLFDANGEMSSDKEITLWLYRGAWDWDLVYEQFGYALQLKLESSEGYRDVVNAIFDALAQGTSERTQQLTLAASFGVPVTRGASETVELVKEDANKLNIITDQNVYEFPKGTTAIVAAGDVIAAGDPLTDLFQTFELNRGVEISPTDISALTLGSGTLTPGFWGGITFDNATVPTVVEPPSDDTLNYTKISWQVSGFPLDVEQFWSDTHAKGVLAGQTLAMLLDVRTNPTDQPTAASLPTEINPFQFLADNLLRNNAYIVKVKPGSQLEGQLAFVPVDQLRKIQPPNTLMLLIVELAYTDAPVIMEAAGTESAAGYVEELNGFPMMTISETLDAATYTEEKIKPSIIGGRCI